MFSSSPVFTFEPAGSASKLPPLQTLRNAVQRLFRCLSQAPRYGNRTGISFAATYQISFRPTRALQFLSPDPLRLGSATDTRVAAVVAGVHSFRDIPCAVGVALEPITDCSLQCQSRALAPVLADRSGSHRRSSVLVLDLALSTDCDVPGKKSRFEILYFSHPSNRQLVSQHISPKPLTLQTRFCSHLRKANKCCAFSKKQQSAAN